MVSVRAPVGDANIAIEKCCIGRGIAAIKPGPRASGEFLFHLLLHRKPDLDALGSGAIFKAVNKDTLQAFEIELPPLSEQCAIATVLSKIQSAVTVQDRTVARLTELKAATMAKLFREGLRDEPLKQTEIGEIPESWEVAELGQVARIERGKFAHRPRNDPRFYGGNIPFIQTGDVAKSNGRIRTYSQTLNEEGLAISRMFPKGTIVLTIAANIADTGILEFDSAFPDSLVGVTPDETMDAVFLEYCLRTQKSEMDRLAPKGTQKNINIQFLKPWPVSRPSSDEQREIAHNLRCIDDRLDGASARRDALRKLFSSILHLLMTGQVRVRVEAPVEGEVATGREGIDRREPVVPEALPQGVERFVTELVRRFEPERVILFGRHAEGSPSAEGKVGLLVVMDFEGRALAEAVRIEREIEHDFALEVMVRRPEEVRRALESGNPLIKRIVEGGNVLYARPDAEARIAADVGLREPARCATPKGKLSDETLREIVRRVVEAVAPEKIILFGSAARGEMGPDSDVDLLVVKSGVDRL